ncbi:MAG: aminotransferase class IV [Myxococcota bacterium]|nr:aminotransferase class IV [Myxococcota bacterium]
MSVPDVCWIDGRLARTDEPAVRVDDLAFREGRGCYSTTSTRDGRPLRLDRHVARLVRDAAHIGIGALDSERCRRAFTELARAAFPEAPGIVRVQASVDAAGRPHLAGTVRGFGADAPTWTAVTASCAHEGPGPYAGAKVTNHLRFALAAAEARERGADEALLLDPAGRLVEGSRSNFVVVLASGDAVTPPLAAGCVAGVARELALEQLPELAEAHVEAAELGEARELVAINGVRGARPVVALDGRPVGSERPGPLAERLARALEADC